MRLVGEVSTVQRPPPGVLGALGRDFVYHPSGSEGGENDRKYPQSKTTDGSLTTKPSCSTPLQQPGFPAPAGCPSFLLSSCQPRFLPPPPHWGPPTSGWCRLTHPCRRWQAGSKLLWSESLGVETTHLAVSVSHYNHTLNRNSPGVCALNHDSS